MYTIHLALGTVTLDLDGSVVSPCQSTDDLAFVAYHAWLDEGNQPTIDDSYPAPVPQSVNAAQIRLALNQLGVRSAAEAYVAASTDQNLKDLWSFGQTFTPNNPLLVTAASAMGINIDDIFILAATFPY